jgi:hypothetical protein
MSQQAAAGRGGGRGGRGKPRYYPQLGETKGFKSMIPKIMHNTFNTKKNKFAAQFTQSWKNVANYLQCTAALEGYLVAETVRMGRKQVIDLPSAINPNDLELEDKKIIQAEEVKTIAKRHLKLEDSLKKGYATVYDQCLQEVQDKLELTDNCERTQKEQSLHELIQKIERVCVGFDNHKQEVFNLVQALKTLFLYTQGEKDTVEEIGRNFWSLWEKVETFGGSPGVHKGLVDGLLSNTTWVKDMHKPTDQEIAKAEDDSCKAVKAALKVSGAVKPRYGKLQDKLANNYLLGSNQYPDTFEKAMCILGNYQVGKTSMPFRASPNDTGVAFIQQGGQGGQGQGGRGKGAVEVTRLEARELMLVEGEAQAMQVPSQGGPEETPLRQTAEESHTATTAEPRTNGRMSALTYQVNSNNNSIWIQMHRMKWKRCKRKGNNSST